MAARSLPEEAEQPRQKDESAENTQDAQLLERWTHMMGIGCSRDFSRAAGMPPATAGWKPAATGTESKFDFPWQPRIEAEGQPPDGLNTDFFTLQTEISRKGADRKDVKDGQNGHRWGMGVEPRIFHREGRAPNGKQTWNLCHRPNIGLA